MLMQCKTRQYMVCGETHVKTVIYDYQLQLRKKLQPLISICYKHTVQYLPFTKLLFSPFCWQTQQRPILNTVLRSEHQSCPLKKQHDCLLTPTSLTVYISPMNKHSHLLKCHTTYNFGVPIFEFSFFCCFIQLHHFIL